MSGEDFPPQRRRVVQALADDLIGILRAASPWGYPPEQTGEEEDTGEQQQRP
jgi:hypothetical protein